MKSTQSDCMCGFSLSLLMYEISIYVHISGTNYSVRVLHFSSSKSAACTIATVDINTKYTEEVRDVG